MRIKDSPKNNAEGSSKKESKKKNNKQKTEGNGSVTGNKSEKSATAAVKVDKEGKRQSPTKDVPEKQVNKYATMSADKWEIKQKRRIPMYNKICKQLFAH